MRTIRKSTQFKVDRKRAMTFGKRLAIDHPGTVMSPSRPPTGALASLCTLVGAPSSYLRQLPAAIAGINLQHGLLIDHRGELIKTLEADNGGLDLRAVTGPDYGRIWDHELVAAVRKDCGQWHRRHQVEGAGRARLEYDDSTIPIVDVTKDTTTLYAS